MKKHIMILCTIFMLSLMLSTSTVANLTKTKDCDDKNGLNNFNENDNVYVQEGIYLNRLHVGFLRKSLKYIPNWNNENWNISQILKEIIGNIELYGFVNSEEISEIIGKYNTDITHVYGSEKYQMTRIFTRDLTDGGVYPLPKIFRTLCLSFPTGAYVYYNPTDDVQDKYGWHLDINNEEVERGSGRIFGFFGIAFNGVTDSGENTNWFFSLRGYSVLVFHEA